MKKSELAKLTLPQLRAFVSNNAIEIDNNLTKSKTLEAILNSKFEFVPEEPRSGRYFKIGSRQIEALGRTTSIGAIKSFVTWELNKLKKVNPEYKSENLTVTLPNGVVFKASQLNYASNFVKKELFGALYASTDLTNEQNQIREKVSEIIKYASKVKISWDKVGSDNPQDIMSLFEDTVKNMTEQGLIEANAVPQIEMY